MGDVLLSFVRTYVPVAIGAALTWVAKETGFVLDESTSAELTVTATAVVIALYYGIVRLVEVKVPALGWLLGSPRVPTYMPPATVVRTEVHG